MSNFLHFSILCLLIGFSSCIKSTQDAMDVYEFEGDSSAEYYANYGVGDEFLEPVFRDSILPNILKLEFDKLINYYDVLKDTPMESEFSKVTITECAVFDAFKNRDLQEGIDLYNSLNVRFPIVEKVFTDSVFPIIARLPYAEIKEISQQFSNSKFKSHFETILANRKNDYLNDLRNEFECQIDSAITAFDETVTIAVRLEVDSLAQEDVENLINNLSFDIKNITKSTKIAKTYENALHQKWPEFIKGEKYNCIIKKHAKSVLTELQNNQAEFYHELTSKSYPIKSYSIKTPALTIECPDSTYSLIKEYSAGKRKELVSTAADFGLEAIPKVGDLIAGAKAVIEIGHDFFNSFKGKITPEDQLAYFLRDHISQSIDDDYIWECRQNFITAVTISYDNLYEQIEKNL